MNITNASAKRVRARQAGQCRLNINEIKLKRGPIESRRRKCPVMDVFPSSRPDNYTPPVACGQILVHLHDLPCQKPLDTLQKKQSLKPYVSPVLPPSGFIFPLLMPTDNHRPLPYPVLSFSSCCCRRQCCSSSLFSLP